jgi:1,4-alpha-glucan branching enzyme
MPSPLGRLCLVLHGHLPYVLHHGNWPHGESWLYEGAAETYLPLLELLDECADKNIRAGITIGLTPVLLEQLAHDHFKTGFGKYLNERMALARHDAAEFTRTRQPELTALAHRWEKWYADRLAYFEKINRNIPAAFAGHFQHDRIEILTSAATHAYLPLLAEDASLTAQLAIGSSISAKHLGKKPAGIWLPECAYRPEISAWQPPVLYDHPRHRPGMETLLASQHLSHFFIDNHLISQAKPLAITDETGTRPTSEALLFWDNRRGWGTPLDPVAVASIASTNTPTVHAFARHPRVSEQVWSAVTGYPGADAYLEFHRKHGDHGLRYHRVTSHHTPLMEKQPYDPAQTPGKTYEQAQHFCGVLREVLADYTKQTGRVGTITASFDAELFGHWWFEGLQFLRDVLLTLVHDGTVEVLTSAAALEKSTVDKVVHLPEGSWGEGGHHHVWLNDHTRWLWETEYRAERRFAQLLAELPWRTHPKLEIMLQKAARELLLLQSSDWPFAIHSAAAADYGIARFALHHTRFDRLATLAKDLASSLPTTDVQQTELAEADAHDVIFNEVDLTGWQPNPLF